MKHIILFTLLLLPTLSAARTLNPSEMEKRTVASSNMVASFTSDIYVLRSPNYAVYARWDRTGATWSGTVRLQGSADGTFWEDVSGTDISMNGSGSTLWNKDDAGYLYGRVQGELTIGASANVYVKLNRK